MHGGYGWGRPIAPTPASAARRNRLQRWWHLGVVGTLLLLLLLPALPVAALSYAPPFNYAASTPNELVLGDINGDGLDDLVTANADQNSVSVFLRNADGTFGAQTVIPLGTSIFAVALGDFGGTSSIDVAVTKLNTNAVTVLLNTTIPGTTTVTFAAPLDTPVGSLPLALTAGNFDGDSTLDLAVANFGGNSVAILLGTGTGTFILAPASPIVVGANPRSLAAGDLNGDGFADLAIANYTDNTVAILAGAGTGLFGPAVPYPVGAGPQSLAVADLNGDTVVDVVTTNQVADGVSVLLNSAATPGTFASAAAYPSGDNPYAVAVGNLDADGLPDLAVANNDGNTVAVLLNVPSAPGTFTAPSPPASAARSRSM